MTCASDAFDTAGAAQRGVAIDCQGSVAESGDDSSVVRGVSAVRFSAWHELNEDVGRSWAVRVSGCLFSRAKKKQKMG